MSGSSADEGDLDRLEARTRALLASDRLSAPTRRALQARFDRSYGAPQALSAAQMQTLQAACLRLIPEPALVARVGLAAALDARLAEGTARGWRYAEAPADLPLIAAGLDALGTEGFAEARPEVQDRHLSAAQRKDGAFASPGLGRWFEELMSVLVELFYAHPLVQVAIGYDGMADVGERAVGLQAVGAEGEPLVA